MSNIQNLSQKCRLDLSELTLHCCYNTTFINPAIAIVIRSTVNSIQSCTSNQSVNHTHNHFTALFPWPSGWAGARTEILTLWCKGRLTEADTPTIRLGATPSGLTSAHLHHPPHIFYGPDALPAAQPTVSKHWRQLAHSD